jgi:HAD superfamily hydrolase (TIGR01509 family)
MTRAVIFDIDGTLVDSVDLHAQAWQRALQHFGHEVGFDAVRSQIGKGGDQLLPVFLSPEECERVGAELQAWRAELFRREYLPSVRPFPGVPELFRRLLDDGKQVAIASSAKGEEKEEYKRIAGVADLLDAETSAQDADRSKPAPDIFAAALERLGSAASETVVVGDSPYDAQAAGKLGMRTIGLLCGGFAEADLRQAGCVEIHRDPAQLLQRYVAKEGVLF